MKITALKAREILDSRGNPTVEVDIYSGKTFASASVPSGASTGIYEAHELRDGGRRYFGKGVTDAVLNVKKVISKKLVGMDPFCQKEIDEMMIALDGTESKSKLGANAILAVSLACARLASELQGVGLYKYISKLAKTKPRMPFPFMNVINGGKHAGTDLKFQEFMIAPREKVFSESLRAGAEAYHSLKDIILKKYGRSAVNVGDEGGFAPPLSSMDEALSLLSKVCSGEMKLAMDSAASEFFSNGVYDIGSKVSARQLEGIYEKAVKDYPLISLEDPFSQDDLTAFAGLTAKIGRKVQIVGDDLLVTNVGKIKLAVECRACNALLLKVNQIGTLTEAVNAAKLAFDNGWNVMVSHRSGETEDSFIADLAVGLGAGQIKAGAPCRSERTSKYNRLLRIEEEL
jgi:enolase